MWIHAFTYSISKFKFYPMTTKLRKCNLLNQLFSTQLQQSLENFDYKFWNSNYIQWQPSLENAIFLNQLFSTQLQQSLENSIFSIRNFEIHILSNDTKLRKFNFLDFYLCNFNFFHVMLPFMSVEWIMVLTALIAVLILAYWFTKIFLCFCILFVSATYRSIRFDATLQHLRVLQLPLWCDN